QIGAGNSEQKRSALFEIRNRQSEISSRIAIPALKDSDEIVRATAAFSVIYLPKDEAFNALSPNLQDKSEIVRREMAYALGKVQNSLAIKPLIFAFQKDKSTEVKNACIIALGEIGDASAIEALTQVLRQKPTADNDFLRRSAARSIGQIAQIIQIQKSQVITPQNFLPDKYKEIKLPKYLKLTDEFPIFRESVGVLIQTLQNSKESADVRREAAFALGAIGDQSAISVLQTNLINQDYYLAEICKEALRKISA
ncbi:MAG: HEAT repeat domain-containing protein, partial [Actinomycetota bacterium]